MALFSKKAGSAASHGALTSTMTTTTSNPATWTATSPSSWWGPNTTTVSPLVGGISSGSTTTWTNWQPQTGYQYTPYSLESSVSFDLEGDADACLAKLEGVDFTALALLLGKPSIIRYPEYSEVSFSVSSMPAKQWPKIDKYLTSSGVKTLKIMIRLGAEVVDEKTLKVTFASSNFDGDAGKYILKYTTKA